MRSRPDSGKKRRNSIRGVALIEALVALLIMAFGMVALVGLQGTLRRGSDLAKQRGEAIRLAQQEMESLRSYSVLVHPDPANPAAGVRAFADIATPAASANVGEANSNATFMRTRSVTDGPVDWPGNEPLVKALRVRVDWIDRAEGPQFVQVDSFISRADPGLSGSLGIAPASTTTQRPAGREALIPLAAKDLGNGSSVFVPSLNDTVAWVFNNLTGVITGQCTVAMNTSSAAVTAAMVAGCSNNRSHYLLSGFVRFSFLSPPDSVQPNSPALTLDVGLVLPGTVPNHQCYDDSAQVIAASGSVVSFYCIVEPNNAVPRVWSARLNLLGIPLAVGDPSPRKICRFTADYDGNGSISNSEHPLNYVNVSGALTRQNFLVINASESCPAGHAVNAAAGFFTNTATVLHQP